MSSQLSPAAPGDQLTTAPHLRPPSSSPGHASPALGDTLTTAPHSPAPGDMETPGTSFEPPSRPSNSRELYNGKAGSGKGRGKGGRFRLNVNSVKYPAPLSPAEEVAEAFGVSVKESWKDWVEDYKLKIKRELAKHTKKNPDKTHIKCARCEKKIDVSKYINHKSKYDYCPMVHPYIKLTNFKKRGTVEYAKVFDEYKK